MHRAGPILGRLILKMGRAVEARSRFLLHRRGAKRWQDVRLRVRANSEVKVLIGQKHWSVGSGRQLRRREAGWRAAGSERPVHKQNNVELDSA
jgi:hypothetical protein